MKPAAFRAGISFSIYFSEMSCLAATSFMGM